MRGKVPGSTCCDKKCFYDTNKQVRLHLQHQPLGKMALGKKEVVTVPWFSWFLDFVPSYLEMVPGYLGVVPVNSIGVPGYLSLSVVTWSGPW